MKMHILLWLFLSGSCVLSAQGLTPFLAPDLDDGFDCAVIVLRKP